MKEKVNCPINLGNDLNWGKYREPVREMGPTGLKEFVETVPSFSQADGSMNYIKISLRQRM